MTVLSYGVGMEEPGDDLRGEKRWPMAVTLIVAMALPFLLPPKYALGPRLELTRFPAHPIVSQGSLKGVPDGSPLEVPGRVPA